MNITAFVQLVTTLLCITHLNLDIIRTDKIVFVNRMAVEMCLPSESSNMLSQDRGSDHHYIVLFQPVLKISLKSC